MIYSTLSPKAKEIILQDAIQRDLPTARRFALLKFLWQERYLTRVQLIARVEFQLGKNCFGISAWKDNFYRDMRIVKLAFKAAGLKLVYSRRKRRPGYYIQGQPALSPEFRQMLANSAAEADQRQIDIYHRLPPAGRFRQGCSTSDAARRAIAYRIRQERPEITTAEANREGLLRAYKT